MCTERIEVVHPDRRELAKREALDLAPRVKGSIRCVYWGGAGFNKEKLEMEAGGGA